MPIPVAGQPGGMIAIKMQSDNEIKAEELYFIHVPKEGEARGEAPVALSNVKFDSK